MRRTDFPPVSLDAWRRRVRAELDGAEPESLVGRSLDGLELEPLYTEESRRGAIEVGAWPAGAPRLCPRIELVGRAAMAAEIGEHLAGGAGGVWIDRPGERGLETAGDLSVALGSEDVGGAEIWFDATSEAERWVERWEEWLASSGPAVRLRLGGDPLGALARRGAVRRPLDELLDEAVRAARVVSERLPEATGLTVSTVSYQEAGADLATELGFAVATLLAYLEAAAAAGIGAEELLPRVALRFAVGCQVFPEIAKLRAARLMWRAVAGAARLESVPPLALHVVGSRRTYARREPEINLLRATQQAAIAALGGATALSLPAHDDLGGAPSERGRRLARAIPLVLEHEGRLGRVADPVAGAYMVEVATRRLAEAGWELAREIEQRGGMGKELLSGTAAERVEVAWRERRRAYEEGRAGLTGVTDYVDGGAEVLPAGDAAEHPVPAAEPVVADGERIEPFELRRDATPYEVDGAEGGESG